ncbi:MAG: hypothetical protein FD180_2681 [Planctomycetota bacterium]|nr:MAG: hypothetical protein FD180_2681 [Planctomycetota bacterium]
MDSPPPGSRVRAVVGCGAALLIFGVVTTAFVLVWRHVNGSPVSAAEEFLEAMSRGDDDAARMACEPASGVPIEAALAIEGPAWGTEWTIEERSRSETAGQEVAQVEARVKGRDGKSRTVEITVSRFVSWRVRAMKLDGRSSFAPAELPAGMSMPVIGNIEVRKSELFGEWEVEVTFTVSALKTEARDGGKWASVVHSLVLRDPGGSERTRMETTADVNETASGLHAFTDRLKINPSGAAGKYVLREIVTDKRTHLSAEKDIEFTLP